MTGWLPEQIMQLPVSVSPMLEMKIPGTGELFNFICLICTSHEGKSKKWYTVQTGLKYPHDDKQTSKHAERHALLTSCLPSGTNNA